MSDSDTKCDMCGGPGPTPCKKCSAGAGGSGSKADKDEADKDKENNKKKALQDAKNAENAALMVLELNKTEALKTGNPSNNQNANFSPTLLGLQTHFASQKKQAEKNELERTTDKALMAGSKTKQPIEENADSTRTSTTSRSTGKYSTPFNTTPSPCRR